MDKREPSDGSNSIDEITRIYQDSLLHFLRKLGASQNEAMEIVHDFLVDKLIRNRPNRSIIDAFQDAQKSSELTSSSDNQFGKYLRVSLRNYFYDRRKKSNRDAKSFETLEVAINSLSGELPQNEFVESEFDLYVAQSFIDRLVDNVEAECMRKDQIIVWKILQQQLILPALTNSKPSTYDAVAEKFKLANPKEANNLMQTGIRKFQRILFQMCEASAKLEGFERPEDVKKTAARKIESVSRILRQHGLHMSQTAMKHNISDSGSTSQCDNVLRLLQSRSIDQMWSNNDLRQMWRRITSMPLKELFEDLPNDSSRMTITELWDHPNADLDTLRSIKRYGRKVVRNAKTYSQSANDEIEFQELPSQIAFVMYVISTAVAKTKRNILISKDNIEQLAYRVRSVLSATWLDETTHRITLEAISRIESELPANRAS